MEAKQEFLNEVSLEANRLVYVIATYRPRLTAIERHMIDNMAVVSPDGQKALSLIRRVLDATEIRLDEISRLLALGTQEGIDSANRLVESPLTVKNDSLHKLITEDPIPPIPTLELKKALDIFFGKIQITKRTRQANI